MTFFQHSNYSCMVDEHPVPSLSYKMYYGEGSVELKCMSLQCGPTRKEKAGFRIQPRSSSRMKVSVGQTEPSQTAWYLTLSGISNSGMWFSDKHTSHVSLSSKQLLPLQTFSNSTPSHRTPPHGASVIFHFGTSFKSNPILHIAYSGLKEICLITVTSHRFILQSRHEHETVTWLFAAVITYSFQEGWEMKYFWLTAETLLTYKTIRKIKGQHWFSVINQQAWQ